MQYTEDQKKAIEARHRNILVAAAAGSGKTRVLVDRIIAQLLARECSVDEMLVVTFTNAAATEMRERIDKALQKKLLETDDRETAAWLERQIVLLSGASICTFHAFCQKVIRQNIDVIDVDPQFRLASDQEMVLMRRDVLEELLETSYKMPEDEAGKAKWQDFLEFVDDYGDDHGDEAVYEAVLKLYHFCQSQPFPKAWLRQQQERYERELLEIIRQAHQEYVAYPEDQRSLILKVQVVLGKTNVLAAMEKDCDAEVNNICSQMTAILKANGRDTAIVREVKKTYTDKKAELKQELIRQTYSGGDGSGSAGHWLYDRLE